MSAARDAFDLVEIYGFQPRLLDVGGGYPGTDDGKFAFRDVARVVSEAVDHYNPVCSGVEIITKPGRYFTHSRYTVFV